MSPWLPHLPVAPIVVPLVAGAAMLLFAESRRLTRAAISLTSVLIQLVVAIVLMSSTEGISVYAIGGWAAPFGIVLVVDRLSALMLVLTAMLALPALVYSLARWDRAGVYYHPLFQFLLMGVNGAFLTGDLFNLFVFFEVFLAASYGLLLHGSGAARVKAGLHYIVVNLVGSLLFLIGAAVIYGVTGTLNMADLAVRAGSLAPQDLSIFDAGVGVLGIAFLIKAGAWPLNFWLPGSYGAAGAPVAAVFSILTKVGVYALLRMGSLSPETGTLGTIWRGWLILWRARDDAVRHCRHAGRSAADSTRGLLGDCILRHNSSGLRAESRGAHCACVVLHVELRAGRRSILHADRNDRPHPHSNVSARRCCATV